MTAGLDGEKVFTYAYNHVAMSSMTYPSGRTVSYQFDRAGRVRTATGVKGGVTTNYVTGIDYAAHGAVEEMALANGARKERACYNNRLQMTGLIVGQAPAGNCGSATNTLFRIYNQYGANNNGNLVQQDVADSGSWLVQQVFTYDKLNRLETATEGTSPNGWKQTFGYDRWGNRWLDTNGSNSFGVNTTGVANNSSWFTAKNRLALVGPDGGFDAAGNQVSSESFALSYDAENRMVGSTSGTLGTQSYGYDGEGRRVKKTAGSLTTYYVYDAAGQLAAEYESGGSGPASPCTTCYVAGDHLGSTRALWDEAGLKARYDYHPFGEAIAADRNNRASLACAAGVTTCYNGPSGVAQRFTGQLRDAETGLDYFGARYVTVAQGRFTSPDKPFMDQLENDPQSWNLYSYVRNNPLTFIDPNGEDCIYTNDFASTGTVTVETGSCSKKGGTFVDGTIDTKSITYDRRNNSLGYSYSNDAAGTGGAGTLGLPSQSQGDLSPFGQALYNEMSRRRDASNQFIGAFMAGSVAVGATGGTLAYFSGATSGSGLTTLGLRSGHGAFRLAVRGFSEADVALTKTGNVLKQADGAKVFIKELADGKFNVIVEGKHGVVTAIKNISQKSLEKLATRYGWK